METNFRKTDIDNIEYASVITQKNLLATVFAWMFAGMVITTISSLSFAFIPSLFDIMITQGDDGYVHKSMLGHIITFAPLILLIGMGAGFRKLSYVGIVALFLVFSTLFGISISYIFIIYQVGSIANIFLSTCGLFGTMALVGYFTKTDLTKLRSILMIGLVGIFIASLINYFMHSEQMGYIISVIAVIIFTGLTAYDMQNIKNTLAQNDGSDSFKKLAVMGALNLYLDFINLFLSLLNIFGKRN
ncbi:MAG: Bax inhibitor-1/YccA family protein [Bacteroidota bacterium]